MYKINGFMCSSHLKRIVSSEFKMKLIPINLKYQHAWFCKLNKSKLLFHPGF